MEKFFKTFKNRKFSIIAEIKFASPSEGILGDPKTLLLRVKQCEKAGADAISIVTEKKRFNGDPKFVTSAKKQTKLPILMKEFVVKKEQIFNAKKHGADALLLIARIIRTEKLNDFVKLCQEQGIEPVVEVFSRKDLERAIKTKTKIIAVNARDLETFKVDVEKAGKLIKEIPDRYIKLGFSGVKSNKEIEMYKDAGVKGVLIGTSLMRAKNIKQFMASLKLGNKFFLNRYAEKSGMLTNSFGANAPAKKLFPSPLQKYESKVKVKICATRSLKAAQVAADKGAEFLGLVFTPHVKTHTVDMKVAKQIGKKMKGKINLVGVFQNMPLSVVQKIIKDCNLDYAQFHGDEDPDYLGKIKIRKIKAFRLAGGFDIKKTRTEMKRFKVDFYLVDRPMQSEGPMLDLRKIAELAREFPLVFAGGLNPENVSRVIQKVNPVMVDVASGVETNGQQDKVKISQFIKKAKGVSL